MWSVKCGVWSLSLECEERSVKCEVWSVKCEVWIVKEAVRSVKCEVRTVKCEVWSVKCEVWSVKFEVWSAKSAVWSVECEDFASSLAKKTACRGKDTVGTGFSSNYRSFIFGKLPPPACPGTCTILYYQRKLGSNTSELRMTFTWWNWLWWRVVRDLTIHNITIHNKRIRSGGIDLDEGWYITSQYLDEGWYITQNKETMTQGGDEGRWWRWEVVTMGSGEEGKWWRREVMMKGSGEEGRRGRWEVVRKGSGEEGKWTKEGGDDGKWWRWEVVRKGSGDETRWWWWEVVTTGSGEEGKRWRRQAVSWGGSRSTKPCVFPCKVAAAGDERYLACAAVAAAVVSCANWFLLCVLQRVVVSVCVVLCGSGISRCRLHWNGCLIVVIWCCHVRR